MEECCPSAADKEKCCTNSTECCSSFIRAFEFGKNTTLAGSWNQRFTLKIDYERLTVSQQYAVDLIVFFRETYILLPSSINIYKKANELSPSVAYASAGSSFTVTCYGYGESNTITWEWDGESDVIVPTYYHSSTQTLMASLTRVLPNTTSIIYRCMNSAAMSLTATGEVDVFCKFLFENNI